MNELTTAVAAPFDKAALLERVDGDTELLREMAELFFADNARLVGAVRAAVAAGDAEALRVAAHTLKGSVGNFCAGEAAAAARELEVMGRAGELGGAADALRRLEGALATFVSALRELTRAA
jgi:HPt (histidine-containing phosphotransfer) domain-containing protein